MIITRDVEETIRQIVREEIALDELRKIEREATPSAPRAKVPGGIPTLPGTEFYRAGGREA